MGSVIHRVNNDQPPTNLDKLDRYFTYLLGNERLSIS